MKHLKTAMTVLTLVAFAVVFSGCATGTKEEKKAPAISEERLPSYYDFNDIAIPSDLKLVPKKSFVYGTTQSKGGILVFTGRITPASLAAFFQQNMQKDGWKLINTYKYPDYLLVFTKGERGSAISISETLFSTKVEIRVGMNDTESTKPPTR